MQPQTITSELTGGTTSCNKPVLTWVAVTANAKLPADNYTRDQSLHDQRVEHQYFKGMDINKKLYLLQHKVNVCIMHANLHYNYNNHGCSVINYKEITLVSYYTNSTVTCSKILM